jgi:hypothetical protein
MVVVLVVGGVALLRTGKYGLTIFVVLPVILGGLASWIDGSATGGRAARVGAGTVAVSLCSLLLLGLEGFICIAVALPLSVPLGAQGGWLG